MNYKRTQPGMDLTGKFFTLLCRWRGSLYKLCYRELLFFILAFYTCNLIYHFALEEDQQSAFKKWVKYCDKYLTMIPLPFILGFYVTIVATRWWQQCMALPWPDRLMLAVAMYIPGVDEESRLLRKTLCQNCNLMAVLVFRSIADSVRNRLKTLQDVVNAGFMTNSEKEVFESTKADINIFWLPGVWFSHRLQEAQRQGRITDPFGAQMIMNEMLEFRSRCGILWSFDWVSIPLVYTQVVTLATYSFLVAAIFGRQHIDWDKSSTFDVYFPSWTVLQLLFYIGLLNVAENMINPYGDDAEDFDLNFLIDRHAKVIHLGTDACCEQLPSMDESILGHDIPPRTREVISIRDRLTKTFSSFSLSRHHSHKRDERVNIDDHLSEESAQCEFGNHPSAASEKLTEILEPIVEGVETPLLEPTGEPVIIIKAKSQISLSSTGSASLQK